MTDLTALYQSMILDHNRRPRNYREMPEATARGEGRNPLCGDEVVVWAKVEDDRLADVSFRGVGCAISRASASMMTAALQGKTVAEADEMFERFHSVVTGKVSPEDVSDMERPVQVFAGVAKFPVRVKCASLPWHALQKALHDPAPINGSGAGDENHAGGNTPLADQIPSAGQ
jgi:nitrogen fixation protein NifU and related proteins